MVDGRRDPHSPWLDIPLADYEGHMAFPAIGQAQMLAAELGELLDEYSPSSLAVLGCAGGNGFDRIPRTAIKRTIAVDINPAYVQTVARRYAGSIRGLELYVADVARSPLPFDPVDFVYAALLFEYVEPLQTLRHIRAACQPNGVLATILQLPCESAISPSPFNSLQALSGVMRPVSPEALADSAAEIGFVMESSREITLNSGKQFRRQVFRLRPR